MPEPRTYHLPIAKCLFVLALSSPASAFERPGTTIVVSDITLKGGRS